MFDQTPREALARPGRLQRMTIMSEQGVSGSAIWRGQVVKRGINDGLARPSFIPPSLSASSSVRPYKLTKSSVRLNGTGLQILCKSTKSCQHLKGRFFPQPGHNGETTRGVPGKYRMFVQYDHHQEERRRDKKNPAYRRQSIS